MAWAVLLCTFYFALQCRSGTRITCAPHLEWCGMENSKIQRLDKSLCESERNSVENKSDDYSIFHTKQPRHAEVGDASELKQKESFRRLTRSQLSLSRSLYLGHKTVNPNSSTVCHIDIRIRRPQACCYLTLHDKTMAPPRHMLPMERRWRYRRMLR